MDGSPFVGREEELAVLRDELTKAERERPRVILLEGEPGIGKTSLVREFLDEMAHVNVLRAVGDATQTGGSYALVNQLSPGLDGIGEGGLVTVRDPIQVGAQLLQVIGERQGTRPLCLVFDDAPEADLPSLHALLFALRRLQVDRVMTILLGRSDSTRNLPAGFGQLATLSGRRITLTGLPYRTFQLMASLRCGRAPSTQFVKRLWEFTNGNPLHATALLDEYSMDELGRAGHPMPPPPTFTQSVVRRLDRCSASTRELVAVASVLGRVAPLPSVTALVAIADPLAALEEAVAAGLLEPCVPSATVDVCFAHPLIHSTVYHRLTARQRTRLHSAAAGIASSRDSSLRHRIAAASNEDRQLVDDCVHRAAELYSRQEFEAAAGYFTEAARLSPSLDDRTERHWRGVECWLNAGDMNTAQAQASAAPIGGRETWSNYTLGRLALAAGRFDEARRRLRAVCEASSSTAVRDDWQLVRGAAADLAHMSVAEGRAAEAIAWGRRALFADPAVTSDDHDLLGIITIAHGIAGQTAEALAGVAWLDNETSIGPSSINPRTARGVVRLYSDDLQGARSDLNAVAEASHAHRPHQRTVLARGHLADVEYRSGNWDRAIVHAEQALSIAVDTDQVWLLAFLHANASYPWSRRGVWDQAEQHANQALELANATRIPASVNYASTATAMLALSRDQPDLVIEATDEVSSWQPTDGLFEPGMLCWPELRAEALVRVGRLDEAAQLVERLLDVARARGRDSTQAAAHRVRGLLEAARGDVASGTTEFAEALDHAHRVAMPFELGLTRLQYGAHLRRDGQRRLAAHHLREAEGLMAALGATPYLSVAQTELAACGLTPRSRRESDWERLTPQELAVAQLVADGQTNRELASHLYVSIKTVEFHIRNIYSKLGVHSRVQLTNYLVGKASMTV